MGIGKVGEGNGHEVAPLGNGGKVGVLVVNAGTSVKLQIRLYFLVRPIDLSVGPPLHPSRSAMAVP